MKRAIVVGASTIAGLSAVLLANPDGEPPLNNRRPPWAALVAPSATATTGKESSPFDGSSAGGTGSSETDSSKQTSDPTDTAPEDYEDTPDPGGSEAVETYLGTAIQVRNFGTMQVQIGVADGRIADITALQVPDWDAKSQTINSYAVPQLIRSALNSQSADVTYVSGATFTSMAFKQSLQAALLAASLT